jgi:hypothetical protein
MAIFIDYRSEDSRPTSDCNANHPERMVSALRREKFAWQRSLADTAKRRRAKSCAILRRSILYTSTGAKVDRRSVCTGAVTARIQIVRRPTPTPNPPRARSLVSSAGMSRLTADGHTLVGHTHLSETRRGTVKIGDRP